MKRRIFLIVILALFLMPLVILPDRTYTNSPVTNVYNSPAIPSGDGDESSESITSFSETLADDTALDPDSDTNGDFSVSEWGSGESVADDEWLYPDSDMNDTYRDTAASYADDCSDISRWTNFPVALWDVHETTGDLIHMSQTGTGTNDPARSDNIEPVSWTSGGEGTYLFVYYKWKLGTGFDQGEDELDIVVTGTGAVTYDLTQNSGDETFHTVIVECATTSLVSIQLKATVDLNEVVTVWVDWIVLDNRAGVEFRDGVYSESFADVSDWSEDANWDASDSWSTDGDVLSLECFKDSSNDYDYLYSDVPSITVTGTYYVEVRWRMNVTTIVHFWIRPWSTGWGSGDYTNHYVTKVANTWTTSKFMLEIDAVESIGLCVQTSDASAGPVKVDIDYLRIVPANETGWQHDGSTTSGTSESHASSGTDDITSDGDILHITGTYDLYSGIDFSLDTTATESMIFTADYPFMAIRWNASIGQDVRIRLRNEDSTSYYMSLVETGSFVTTYINIEELLAAGSYLKEILIYDDLSTQDFYVDYVKVYSLINWTYLGAAGNPTNNVMYYDSGESAIVVELELSAGADNLYFQTENITIGYDVSDMVLLMTVKASANSSLRVRPRIYYSEGNDYATYFVYDSYQMIAMPISSLATTTTILGEFYCYDWSTGSPSSGTVQLFIKDNITIRPSWYDGSTESGTYGESFANVSDWRVVSGTLSTDGDIISYELDAWQIIDSDVISIASSEGLYLEVRAKANKTVSGRIYITKSDGGTGGAVVDNHVVSLTTNWQTFKWLISDMTDYSAGTMECIRFSSQTSDATINYDYLRIAPADEMGWQDDFSQVSGKTSLGSPVFSNGDVIHVDGTQGAGYERYEQDFWLKQADYPFVEIKWKAILYQNIFFRVQDEDDNWYGEQIDPYVVEEIWTITRLNVEALTTAGSYIKHLDFYSVTGSVQEFWIDYIKFYSIANYTVSQFSTVTVSDFAYVDANNNLVLDRAVGDYILFEYDPALAVNTATYNVVNATISTSTNFYWREYVAGWTTILSQETRGELSSGTLTDFRIDSYGPWTLSEIKFIEDSTPPEIVSEFVTPSTPDDAGEVTFTAITTDAIEVYKVTLNAVIYPNGFSDVDYDMTEETPDEIWYYTFSTMLEGYYLFSIIATDGANTDIEFLPVSVTEAGISLTPISFIGAGPDFTGVQFSFDCNRAGTFSITEWTEVNATHATDEAETHTGTIINGLNNIFWTKLTTPALTVYFNFTINSGSLQANWTSTYQIAQITFDVVLSDKFTDFDTVFIEGEATKAATYQVYIEDENGNDILRDSGSIPEGSFALSFEMQYKKSLADHFYGIKFTNGSSIDWINGSYYADNPEQYRGGGVVTLPPWWQDPMTWVFIGGGLTLVYVITSGRKEGDLPNAPKELK